MIFLRGNASYLYSTIVTTRGPRRKPRERSGFLKDDSNGFGEIPSTRESLWKVSRRLSKSRQTLRVSPTRVCGIRTLYSGFGNRVQTQQSHLGQRFVALPS